MVSASSIRFGQAFVELLADDSKMVAGLKRARKKIRAFSKTTRDAGLQLTGLSATLATPFVAGAKAFSTFQFQMAQVSTMVDSNETLMKKFNAQILKMSIRFGESTEALAGGLYDILSASIPASKAIDVLEASVKAAKAGLTDTKTAADAITTILNSYGLSADRAADISDWLFTIVKNGKTTFAELAPAIGNVTSIANTAGVSLEELGAMISLLTRNGIQTDNAMTAVNAMISGFIKPGKEAADEARRLGFELSSTTLKSEGLLGVFKRLQGLPPDVIAKLFPNIRGIKGLLPILGKLGQFEGDIKALENRTGSTDTAFKKMAGTINFVASRLKQLVLAGAVKIGEVLQDDILKAIDALTKFSKTVFENIEKNKQLIRSFVKIIGIVALVGGALLAISAAVSVVGFMFSGLMTVVSSVFLVFKIFVGVIISLFIPLSTIMVAVTAAITTAFVALKTFVLGLFTIGLPIGILIGLITIFAKIVEEKFQLISRSVNFLKAEFQRLSNVFTASWSAIVTAVKNGDLEAAFEVVMATINLIWTKGTSSLLSHWYEFKNSFLTTVIDLYYGFQEIADDTINHIRLAWHDFTSYLSTAWHDLTDGILLFWNEFESQAEKTMHIIRGLFDEDYNVDLGIRLAEKERQKIAGDINKERSERERKNEGERNSILRKRQSDQIGNQQGRANAQKNRSAEFEKEKKENEDDLKKARERYIKAIQEATKKIEEEEADNSVVEYRKRRKKDIQNATNKIPDIKQKFDTVGTFSSAALTRLNSGSSNQAKALKAAEETAKNTKKLVKEAKDGGLVWG